MGEHCPRAKGSTRNELTEPELKDVEKTPGAAHQAGTYWGLWASLDSLSCGGSHTSHPMGNCLLGQGLIPRGSSRKNLRTRACGAMGLSWVSDPAKPSARSD